MIWLFILIPITIIAIVAVYFEKKSGMAPPDESKQKDNLMVILQQNQKNTHGPG